MACEDIKRMCSAGHPCQYQYISSFGYGCRYKGYCDFQLPRDSREGKRSCINIVPPEKEK